MNVWAWVPLQLRAKMSRSFLPTPPSSFDGAACAPPSSKSARRVV